METIELKRVTDTNQGMFGVFLHASIPFCVSVELPWRGNLKNVSCIPEGIYTCTPEKHEKFDHCFRVHDVPNRSGILIHCANLASELQGCIAPGTSFDLLYSQNAVLGSLKAMLEIRKLVSDSDFNLVVWGPI